MSKIMYNSLVDGAGLPSNVDTQYGLATGPHFGGAPAAAFNVGPTSGNAMSIFGGGTAGELLTAPSDDHLFSPAVAPITYSYAVVTGTTNAHEFLEKGTPVQISELQDADKLSHARAVTKAKRSGHNLKRMLCHCCSPESIVPYKDIDDGIVGVLAESVDVGTKAAKLHDGFISVTIALQNAAEVKASKWRPPGDEPEDASVKSKDVHALAALDMVAIYARPELKLHKLATVLVPWRERDEMGVQCCLHPEIFDKAPSTEDIESEEITTVASFKVKRKPTAADRLRKQFL